MHDVILDRILDKLGFLRNAFKKAELKNCLLMIFGICFSPKKTINSMAEWLESINQSTLNRFLSFDTKKIFRAYHKEIKKQVKGKVATLIIDDSKIEKTGEEIEKTGYEFDHSKHRNIRCFSIVFSVVKIAGLELPVPFGAEDCQKKKNKEQKRKKSKVTLAMKMIRQFLKITEKAAKRILVFDSWYCATKLIKAIPNNVYWVTRLKFRKSRLIWMNGCWLPVWKFCRRVNSWNFKKVKIGNRYFWVYIDKVDVKDLGEVTVVVSKLSHYSREYVVFISNLDDATEILEKYEERWDIEVFFRSVKQNFGIGDVQLRKYLGNRSYWTIVLLTYSSISFLQHLWKRTCRTAGETLDRLKKLLQNAAADYGMSFGRFTHTYVCENYAKL